MAQVNIPNGEILGAPGPAGSAPCMCFADFGDPNTRSDPMSLLANCSLGSSYQRIDAPDTTHALYLKTGASSGAAPTGVWTNK